MTETPFAENFDRLLGLHQLTADWAAPLLGVSAATVSYWRNGRREPEVASLKRLGEVFELDPFALLTTPFVELLPAIADRERFQSVEQRIIDEQFSGLPKGRSSSSRKQRVRAKRQNRDATVVIEALKHAVVPAESSRSAEPETVSRSGGELRKLRPVSDESDSA